MRGRFHHLPSGTSRLRDDAAATAEQDQPRAAEPLSQPVLLRRAPVGSGASPSQSAGVVAAREPRDVAQQRRRPPRPAAESSEEAVRRRPRLARTASGRPERHEERATRRRPPRGRPPTEAPAPAAAALPAERSRSSDPPPRATPPAVRARSARRSSRARSRTAAFQSCSARPQATHSEEVRRQRLRLPGRRQREAEELLVRQVAAAAFVSMAFSLLSGNRRSRSRILCAARKRCDLTVPGVEPRDLGDLRDRQLLEVLQQEDRPLARRKDVRSPARSRSRISREMARRSGDGSGCGVDVARARLVVVLACRRLVEVDDEAAPLQPVLAPVDADARQPGLEASSPRGTPRGSGRRAGSSPAPRSPPRPCPAAAGRRRG